MPDVRDFAELEAEFIGRVHRVVWCNMATVDAPPPGSRTCIRTRRPASPAASPPGRAGPDLGRPGCDSALPTAGSFEAALCRRTGVRSRWRYPADSRAGLLAKRRRGAADDPRIQRGLAPAPRPRANCGVRSQPTPLQARHAQPCRLPRLLVGGADVATQSRGTPPVWRGDAAVAAWQADDLSR